MQKTDEMPIWVYFALSSISTRKGALILIWSCVVFSLYCIPWSKIFMHHAWVANIFLIEDWDWFAMMIPVTAWYWMSLRWIDNNSKWPDSVQQEG